jgi:hypothetical protein
MRIVPLDRLLLDFAIEGERDMLAARLFVTDQQRQLLLNEHAHGLLSRGIVAMAAGLIEWWPGRAEGWVFVHREARPREILYGCQAVKQWLDRIQKEDPLKYRRLEIAVRRDAPYRETFTRMLGFRLEGVLEAFDPAGRDCCVYRRLASEMPPAAALRRAA